MNNKIGLLILGLMVFSFTVHATPLGAQAFPNVNFDDNNITPEEIQIAQSSFGDPGILPTSPFYFLKRFAEDIQMTFTFDPAQKAQLHLERAKIRLAETQKLIDQNKTDDAQETADDFASEINETKNTRNETMVHEADDVAKRGIIVLETIRDKVPDRAKIAIDNAISRTTNRTDAMEIRENIQRRRMCIQVITPARGPDGEVRDFATPCDVPEGWTRVTQSGLRGATLPVSGKETDDNDKETD